MRHRRIRPGGKAQGFLVRELEPRREFTRLAKAARDQRHQAAHRFGRETRFFFRRHETGQQGGAGTRQGGFEYAGIFHRQHCGRRIRRRDHALQLFPDPLGSDLRQAFTLARASRLPGRVDTCAVPGVEPVEAQEAQIVFAQALVGVADEDDPAGERVSDRPLDHFEQRAVGAGIDGVEAEVAAGGVFRPVLREGDDGAAAIGFDIPAQRGDLNRFAVMHRRDGAVFEPCGHSADGGRFQCGNHFGGGQLGGDIKVIRRQATQRVAHAAADIARAARTRGLQRAHHREVRRRGQPGSFQSVSWAHHSAAPPGADAEGRHPAAGARTDRNGPE